MIQKEIVNIDCLFLHDTQMADLQKEQTLMRRLCGVRPFNIAPPFCPVDGKPDISGKLMIGKPVKIDGWIVRPVTDAQNQFTAATAMHPEIPVLPGFPPLPRLSGFILGFAGDFAASILERYTKSSHIADFQVNVWNYGVLTLEIEIDSEKAYSCSYTVGPVTWKKSR